MNFSRAMASGKRICEVLDEVPDIRDNESSYSDKTIENGDISFKAVSFRYYKNGEGEKRGHVLRYIQKVLKQYAYTERR